jgi:ABC-2 type transport system permease protein
VASNDGAVGAGVIHDIGYQRYAGQRLGRRHVVTALYLHSLRTAFGLGRSAVAKIFPGIVVGLAFVVAVVLVAVRSRAGGVIPYTYLQFIDGLGIPLVVFLAVIAPELVSRDLRSRVLPLYFSRPLRRSDYAVAKLAATISAVWLLLAGPLLVIFLGGAFSRSGGASAVWREFTDFLGGLGYAAITAVVLGAFAVPLASLASRRAIAAVVIVVAFAATAPVIGVIEAVGGTTAQQLGPLVNPATLLTGLETWIYRDDKLAIGPYGPLYLVVAVALVTACVAATVARYRKVTV